MNCLPANRSSCLWTFPLGEPPPQVRGKATQNAREGFTLIELLVVVAIIAVLVALAFPVLGRIQARGNETQCLTNVKSITTAYLAYAADNEGRYPATGTYTVASGSWRDFWTETLLKRGYLSIPSQDVYFNSRASHPKKGVLWCPAELQAAHHGIADYGPSDHVAPHSSDVVPIVRITNPARTVLIGESRRTLGAGYGGSWWLKSANFISNPASATSGGTPLPSRHEDRVHLGFCDGHVEALPETLLRERRASLFSGPYDTTAPAP